MKKICFAILMMTLATAGMVAQKVDDKELVGVWLMETMYYDGEAVIDIDGEGYSSFKYYGADGEYACAEIVFDNKGEACVLPHEYGTYTFADGVYSEMGRPASLLVLTSPSEFRCKFMNRNEVWRKCTTMPQNVIDYIVGKCKATRRDSELDEQIKKICFGK